MGVPDSVRAEVKGLLNVPNETLSEKYLGMPSDVGSSKKWSIQISQGSVMEQDTRMD